VKGIPVEIQALVMDREDNVATAIRPLDKGEEVVLDVGSETITVKLLHGIPVGHKFAIKDIGHGETITKYGETIGKSTVGITRGEHVHIHNVEGLRGRGDKA
jgi:altronate dehydratase small subunit